MMMRNRALAGIGFLVLLVEELAERQRRGTGFEVRSENLSLMMESVMVILVVLRDHVIDEQPGHFVLLYAV